MQMTFRFIREIYGAGNSQRFTVSLLSAMISLMNSTRALYVYTCTMLYVYLIYCTCYMTLVYTRN